LQLSGRTQLVCGDIARCSNKRTCLVHVR
jgi:hypothetical protein